MGRRPFAVAAILLLSVAAFGGLSVGIPLVVAQVASLTSPEPGQSFGWVPGAAFAYGLVSLAAAVGMLLHWPKRTLLAVAPQGFVALALVAVFAAIAAEPALLAVAAISGGAALCAIADRD